MTADSQSRILYVKIRGRAYGPLPESKVREMARKGQFSRIHQVSDDGQSWRAAAEMPELFDGLAATFEQRSAAAGSAAAQTSPAAEPKIWFFSRNDQQIGPMTLTELKTHIGTGAVTGTTLVWREGLDQWQAAGKMSELVAFLPEDAPRVVSKDSRRRRRRDHRDDGWDGRDDGGGAGDGRLDPLTAASMRGIGAWTMFFSVVCFVWAGLLFLAGIFEIASVPHSVPVGAATIMMACALFAGALFLIQHSLAIGQCQRSREVPDLESALRAAGRFWTYTGFVTIVLLAVQLFFLIFALSLRIRDGTLDQWPF